MADRNRGGRSRDDDPIDNDDELELDAEVDEESFDDESFDEDEDVADEKAATKRGAGGRERAVARTKTKEAASAGFFGKIINFIREIFAELQKVIWPTRKELLTYTTVVIVFVAIMMTFVSLLDVGFAKLMFLVFGSNETPAATE